MKFVSSSFVLPLLASAASALTIAEINGNKFQTTLSGQATKLTNLKGLVTAIGPNGTFIRDLVPDKATETSNSILIFTGKGLLDASIRVGDIITVNGNVAEFKSGKSISITEIQEAKLVEIVSRNNDVKPLIIGKDTSEPPTENYSNLDGNDPYDIGANRVSLNDQNPTLQPLQYGLDFWESLSGELVTIQTATAVSTPTSHGEVWVVGNWKVTGRNGRGGLTISSQGQLSSIFIYALFINWWTR